MAIRSGRCTNFGNCAVADSRQVIQVPDGADLVCPECDRQLSEVAPEKKLPIKPIVITIVGLAVLAIPLWLWLRSGSDSGGGSSGSIILRLHGSNTIGAKLVPALAEEFLKQQGAKDVKTVTGSNAEEVTVEGILPGDSSPKAIEIQSHGSATAFTDLQGGKCDIGLSSRGIKPDETRNLSTIGDMTSPANEHVLALDGIAIIINKDNPVQSLTKEQVAKIFSGEITSWTQVLSSRGQIKVYARDDKSGTYDAFKSLVLGNSQLVGTAKRFEDSNALSDAVANDSDGIGFVGLPFIRSAKAVAISESGATPLVPNRLTIATEDYLLSRRLYLYTPTNPQNPFTRKFVEFALSKAGQDVVGNNGFVAQNVKAETTANVQGAPDEYKKLTSNAERLSLNFRFRSGSKDLDNKAVLDLDRVVNFITDLKYTGQNILLFGFADSVGGSAANLTLSNERARVVSEQFQRRGLAPGVVTGFGSQLPVATNDTEEGREKNRRVEIWMKK